MFGRELLLILDFFHWLDDTPEHGGQTPINTSGTPLPIARIVQAHPRSNGHN